jgi:HAD superfamily hydrolase (TIGR01549 family)
MKLSKHVKRVIKDENYSTFMEVKGLTHISGVILDVDGTLVDSNDVHAKAWIEAMADNGYEVAFERVRPLIGMGGDKVLPETIGVQKESEEGKRISQRRKEIFKERYLPGLHAFPEAKELLEHMRKRGLKLTVASSADKDELQPMLNLVGAADLIEEETSSKDAKQSKPDPDVIHITLERAGLPSETMLMIGDTAFDIEAAKKVQVSTIAFRSGGWSDSDLAGAIAIYDGPADLLKHYDESPLAR